MPELHYSEGEYVQRRVRAIDHGEAAQPIDGISGVVCYDDVGLCTGGQSDSVEDNQAIIKVVFDEVG